MIEKIDGCNINPASSSTTKVGEHIPSGFSVSTISSFKRRYCFADIRYSVAEVTMSLLIVRIKVKTAKKKTKKRLN